MRGRRLLRPATLAIAIAAVGVAFLTAPGAAASGPGNVDLKKAVNYAIDRQAMLDQRGAHAGVTNDQYLPPNFPGFADAPLYPSHPDVARARELASWRPGDPMRRAVMYTCSTGPCVPTAQIVQANLAQIGIDVEIQIFPRAVQFTKAGTRGEPFDLTLEGWHINYYDPYEFLFLLDGGTIRPAGNLNFSYYDDLDFRRRLFEANALSGQARIDALGALDVHAASTAAPLATFATDYNREFFSARIGCHAYHGPTGTMSLAALCLRTGTDRTFRWQLDTDIDYVDPAFAYYVISWQIEQATCARLLNYPDAGGPLQPEIAQGLPTVSPDGLTYTFKLRPGVKFTSGNPLTANDVRFSLRRLKNLKDNPSFFMDPVKDIQVVDDLTVRIVLSAPDASFLAALAAVPCGVADSKVVMAKGGTDADDAKDKDKATEWLNNQSEGSGPYKLVAFTKNVEAVLERNAGYWGKKPHFTKVIFKHVPTGTTQREMVERGDADVAHDFDVDIVAKITQGPKIKVLEGLSMNQVYVGVTNSAEQSKELADKRVRQAVSYAIDYDGIIKGIVRGAGERPSTMIPLGILGGDKSLARKRDLAKAKELLTAAGYPNGIELKLTYWTAPLLGVPSEPLAAKLQADLAQAGIKVTLDAKERSVAIAEYRAGKIQLMLASWSPDYLDPDPYADAFYGAGPVPKRVKYSNPKINDIIATAKKEQDVKKREALYMEMNKIALEDVPEIMLIQPKNFVGLNPAIKGYAIHPIWWVTVANLSR